MRSNGEVMGGSGTNLRDSGKKTGGSTMKTTGGKTSQHLTPSASFFFLFLSCYRLQHRPRFQIARPVRCYEETEGPFFSAGRLWEACERENEPSCKVGTAGPVVTPTERAGVCPLLRNVYCIYQFCERDRKEKKKERQRVWFRPRLHASCWEDARRGGQQHGSDAGFVSPESGDRQSSWNFSYCPDERQRMEAEC